MPDNEAQVSEDKIFISYSRKTPDLAEILKRDLAQCGFKPVFDLEDIDPHDRWKERLERLILECDALVFVLTEASASSVHCAWEWQRAKKLNKRRLIVTPGPLPPNVEYRPELRDLPHLSWIHCWRNPLEQGSTQASGLERLEKALSEDVGWHRQQTSMSLDAKLWRANNRPDTLLLQGPKLTAARKWRARTSEANVLEDVREYLAASEAAEARHAEAEQVAAQRLKELEDRKTELERENAELEEKRNKAQHAAGKAFSELRRVRKAEEEEEDAPTPPRVATRTPPPGTDASQPSPPARGAQTRIPREPRAKKGGAVPALLSVIVLVGLGAAAAKFAPEQVASLWEAAQSLIEGESSADPPEPTDPPVSDPPAPDLLPPPSPEPKVETLSDEASWRKARSLGTLLGYQSYVEQWPDGDYRDEAVEQARRRIKAISVSPRSTLILLRGPVVFRELPTFDVGGVSMGAAGDTVTTVDRIKSQREGQWLVFEREGDWPFRFVSTAEVEAPR